MYDAIVVGAGVAGCRTAELIGRKHDVLVLEKDRNISLRDSGIVSGHFFEYYDDKSLVKNEISRMDAVSPSGHRFSLRSDNFAYILKRERTSIMMRKKASRNCDMKYEAVTSIRYEKDRAVVTTNKTEYETRLVVGADGVHSIVRRTLGIGKPPTYLGIFATTTKEIGTGNIEVFANKYYSPEFFSWIIPQNNEYGTITSCRTTEYMDYFMNSLHLPEGKIHSFHLPAGYVKSYGTNAILVGEACGQVKPLTGGGIIFGLRGAGHAAGLVDEAISRARFDSGMMSSYHESWTRDFGHEIRMQQRFRNIFRKFTNNEIDHAFSVFGKHIEKLKDFDYDMLSSSMSAIPKADILKFGLMHIGKLL